MEIIKVAPRGYCKGVVRAINMAKECATKYPDKKITVLGMLVHNRYVIEALADMNIETIDDKQATRLELLDRIEEGIVIFTAHGIAPDVQKKAEGKGLICIDASCLDVVRTQNLVKEHLDKGYEIFYLGKMHHPESEAICSLSKHIHLIMQASDIPEITTPHIFVTNQTTMSIFDIDKIFAQIKITYPNAIFSEEICNATRIRQEAIVDLHKQGIDVLYVVGDPSSNNSNRLAQIAHEQGIQHVFLIDDVHGINEAQFLHAKKVAVTAGASTPTYLTNQVIQYLQTYEEGAKMPNIVISDILK